MKCELHDYLEIACTFSYHIRIKLKSKSTLEGVALSTVTEQGQKEFLLFKRDNNQEHKIPLSNILSITAIDTNPHFSHIDFIKKD